MLGLCVDRLGGHLNGALGIVDARICGFRQQVRQATPRPGQLDLVPRTLWEIGPELSLTICFVVLVAGIIVGKLVGC